MNLTAKILEKNKGLYILEVTDWEKLNNLDD